MCARMRARQAARPRWERPAFWALLLLTAALYLWSLGASGYANSFYSAAAQAGSANWKAFLFGALDAGNAITVDKPPATLWPMAASVRLFGLGSWQILVPQALMGIAAVGVLFAAVRRRVGPAAALLAGALLAVTPVAALMFRFNNPDALLCLLMVCALYCVERALEGVRTKWLVFAGACFGFAFLVKTLQAWLILPVAALVYLVCAPTPVRRRISQLLLGGVTMVVTAGWWVALVELWPASSRPYVGGSQTNSFLELTFGYNGLGRITGNETGSVGGGAPGRQVGGPGSGGGPGDGGGPGGGGGGWGETGIGRLFDSDMGGQIAWLLPAALLLLIGGLLLTRKAARTDALRSSFLLWGGSLVITFVIFSFMSGIFHQYYNIALAPYIAALVAMGGVLLWRAREKMWCAGVLAVAVAGTAVWSYVLLARTPDWFPWLRWAVLVAGAFAASGVLAGRVLPRRLGAAAAIAGLLAAVAGPVAYTLNTASTPKTGSIVTAGPSAHGGMGGPGGGGPGGAPPGMPGGQNGKQGRGQQGGPGGGQGAPGRGQGEGQGVPGAPQGQGDGGGFPPAGGRGGQGGQSAQGRQSQQGQDSQQAPNDQKSQKDEGRSRPGGMGGGGMGGLLNGSKVSAKAEAMLEKNASDYVWVAAAVGSQNAASYQLATESPVMAIGGFNGSDPSPTPGQFKQYVKDGKIHYFLSGGMGPGGNQGTASEISSWVTKNFTEVTVGDATFYDLTKPRSSGN
ncbi:ArnT family glycosyltransferase [Streptomyces sp. PU-14G]|uniref:ArnT family glycosyltransferase n=1 Tax=Streptomyces sp. PU-14G TaxID=2800808 RepID=UPI0034DF0A70